MDGLLTAGMWIAFQSLVQSFLQPINRLMMMSERVQQTAADATRLSDVLSHPPIPSLPTPSHPSMPKSTAAYNSKTSPSATAPWTRP